MTGEGIYYAVATGIAAGRAAARAIAAGDPARAGAAAPARPCAGCSAAHLQHTCVAVPARRGRPRRRRRHPRRRPQTSGVFDDLVEIGLGRRPDHPARLGSRRAGRRLAARTVHRSTRPSHEEDSHARSCAVRGALPEHRYPQEEITDAFAGVIAAAAASTSGCCAGSTPTPASSTGTWRCRWRSTPGSATSASANDLFIEARRRARRAGARRRAQGRRPDPGRRRPDRLRDGHRARRTVPRRADRRAGRAAPGRQAGAAGRARLRRRRRRDRPAARLPRRPPRRRRGAGRASSCAR